jgi:hypothetical protein
MENPGDRHIGELHKEMDLPTLERLEWKSHGWEQISGTLSGEDLEPRTDSGSNCKEAYMHAREQLVLLACVSRHIP